MLSIRPILVLWSHFILCRAAAGMRRESRYSFLVIVNCDNSTSWNIYDRFPFALAEMPCGHSGTICFILTMSLFCFIIFKFFSLSLRSIVRAICLAKSGNIRIMYVRSAFTGNTIFSYTPKRTYRKIIWFGHFYLKIDKLCARSSQWSNR